MGDPQIRRDLIDESLEAAGIYGVTFFIRGRWRMVWIDSYFPCVPCGDASDDSDSADPSPPLVGRLRSADLRGQRWEPLFAQSSGVREAWLMVVEKAFAKLHGCYEALDGSQGGTVASTLSMLSGGVARTELLHPKPGEPCLPSSVLWRRLEEALAHGFVGAGTPPEAEGLDGLVPGHAYAVKRLAHGDSQRLVLLRNPWGSDGWSGRWRRGDSSWGSCPELLRAVGAEGGTERATRASFGSALRTSDSALQCSTAARSFVPRCREDLGILC